MRQKWNERRSPWGGLAQLQAISEARLATSERAKSLVSRAPVVKARGPAPPFSPRLGGITKPNCGPLTYGRTALADAGGLVVRPSSTVDILKAASEDRRDRVVLAWPFRADNGFAVGALHLIEGFTRGWFGHQTVAVWPWRPGITWTSRSILVDPEGVLAAGRASANDHRAGEAWTKTAANHDSLHLIHLRLRALVSTAPSEKPGRPPQKAKYQVRRPTLLEVTPVFAPEIEEGPIYQRDPGHFLNRVRTYTSLKRLGERSDELLSAVGDPARTPLAVFGLPTAESALRKALAFPRFRDLGLDVVIVDLTRTSIASVGDSWRRGLGRLMSALDGLGDGRPPIVVLCDDVFTMGKAEALLRDDAFNRKHPRRPPLADGIFTTQPGLLGEATINETALDNLPEVRFRAEMKDGNLLPLRDRMVQQIREFVAADDTISADGVRAALRYIRHVANLPLGLTAARVAISQLHDGSDDGDLRVRAPYFDDAALAPLNKAIQISPSNQETLRDVKKATLEAIRSYLSETPVSLKLKDMIETGQMNPRTLLVLPDRHVANMFMVSDHGMKAGCAVCDPKTMLESSQSIDAVRWILVKPTPELLRRVMLALCAPKAVDLLGDAAGSSLLTAELSRIVSIPAFSQVRARAKQLVEKIGASVSSLEADEGERDLSFSVDSQEVDFTQSGEAYTGDKIRLVGESGRSMLLRPTTEVLRYTPDELRSFENVSASNVEVDDAILVFDKALLETLRSELARAPKTLKTLREYHRTVAEFRDSLPFETLTDRARYILGLIQRLHPAFGDKELSNIRNWIQVDETTLDNPAAQPRAPRDRKRFGWFMEALGEEAILVDTYWKYGIRLTRSYRQSEGLQFNQRANQFVIDPESFMARSDRDMRGVWQSIIENVESVRRKETIRGSKG